MEVEYRLWWFAQANGIWWDIKCTKTSIPKTLKDFLNSWYKTKSILKWVSFINNYPFKKLVFEWTVQNTLFKSQIEKLFKEINNINVWIKFFSTACKYRNTQLVEITNKYIRYEWTDLFWRKRIKEESINSFVQYVADIYKKYNYGNINTKDYLTWDKLSMKIIISSEIKDKMAATTIQSKLWVCQHFWNTESRWLACWYYDFFTNKAAPVVLIYINWELLGRSAARILLDNNKKEYLFLERTYVTWIATKYYKEILSFLYQKLNPIMPIVMSELTSVWWTQSVFEQAKYAGLTLEKFSWVLRWPKRYLPKWVTYWYYRDSYTFWITDDKYVTWYDVLSSTSQNNDNYRRSSSFYIIK